MNAGVSTASLYPMELEKAFLELSSGGIKEIEIFVNTDCEMSGAYLDEMLRIKKEYGVSVKSVHPYTCVIESLMFFSVYKRRVPDIIDYYKRFFDFMNKFGAVFFIFHGNRESVPCERELYFERFEILQDEARKFGVEVLQENIYYCLSGSIDFMTEMSRVLKDKAKFVIDTKHAIRAGLDPLETVGALGNSIKHVHFSDSGKSGDCLKFGDGDYDNLSFFKKLKSFGYDGNVMIELYKNEVDSPEELIDNYFKFSEFLKNI